MPRNWIKQLRQLLVSDSARRRISQSQRRAETLEQRTYLSASSLFASGHLQILSDANDSIVVDTNPTVPGMVQVTVNGMPEPSLASIQASTVQAITIIGSGSENLIDVSGVTAAEFTFVDPDTGLGVQIFIDGDDGHDTITGSLDLGGTLLGGNGADTITGLDGVDSINGGDGDDSITAGAGNDTIDSGDGNDSIDGGTGDDAIDSGDGADSVNGGDGDDTINSGDGADTVDGGDGDDSINGMFGEDSLVGGAGNDTIFGGSGNDILFGDGNSSTPGDDVVYGNSGNDQIDGGGGADLLDGGTGDDFVVTSQAQFAILETNVNVAEGAAGGGTVANFTITLSSALPTTTSVNVATMNGTAIAGMDYVAVSQTLVFNPGVTTQQVSVPLIGDSINEPTEMFSLVLSNAVGAQIGNGTATATILDDDTAGPPPPGQFDIVVNFGGGLTTTQMAAFTAAEARLEQIITADVPDVMVPGLGLVDDIVINASGVAIDGPGGVLGQAGPTMLRPGSNLPITGDMQFDSADLTVLENAGELTLTILHEMLHSLGFGTIWNLTGTLTGAGTADPQFTGISATAEYNAIFGITAPSVPVESTGGPGTADGHWRETVLDNELMTGFLNSGRPNPLSRITIGSLADIGYQVNLNAADVYPFGLRSSPSSDSESNLQGMILAMIANESMVMSDNWLGNSSIVSIPPASLASSSTASIVTTVTFGEVPFQPVDGLTVGDVTYGFTINGIPSTDADYNSGGPVLVNFLQDPVLEGNATGVLSLDFALPVDSIQFGLARSIQMPVTNGVTVRLYDSLGNLSGTFPLNLITPVSFAEVQFSYTGAPVQRMEIDLTSATTAQGGPRFAIDNLIYNAVTVTAAAGATLIGGDGNDTLIASNGDDILNGGAGNDAIDGGGGNDTIYGGAGQDTLFGSDGSDVIKGQGGVDSIEGGNGDDSIDGGASRDTIYGDDSLGMTSGNDTINGEADNDTLFGGAGDDSILGGSGQDSLSGGAGNDTVDGQGGNDVLDGGEGDDVVEFMGIGDGDDTITTSDGGDTLVITGDSSDETFSIGQSGSTLVISEGTASISVMIDGISGGIENVVLNAGGGDDTITISSVDQVGSLFLIVNGENGNDTISAAGASLGGVRLLMDGGAGDDTITGSSDGDTITGGDGDDMVSGSDGNDTLRGGLGNDVLSGGNGNDLVEGEAGNDTLQGDAGDDSLLGSFGNDVLVGGDGNDTARGGFGDDGLNGMAGDDSLFGDGGNDRIAGGNGDDTIDGGRDDDTIQAHSGNDLINGNHGNDSIVGQAGDDTILGDDGNDTIAGGDGLDLILGQDGDDVINGNAGSDTLLGGDGNDILRGDGSDDTILGEDGDDTINGGSGNDLASTGEGTDTVSNVETIDESFTLPAALLSGLDG